MKRKKNLLQNGEGNNLNQWNILLWNTSIQRAPPFRGHKIGSRKNVHIIFVSFTSVVGTRLFGERDTFSGSQNLGLPFIQGTP